jgi:predicted amidohydrolase YtcJ
MLAEKTDVGVNERVGEKADVIFFNGKIVTLDSDDTIATAVAIKNGQILAVTSGEEVTRTRSPATKLIDLKGKTMLPGLIDSHTHLSWATLVFQGFVDGRCPPNKSIADILERIREKVRETPKGDWIPVQGSFFANHKLAEKRLPTKEDLDLVAPEHPVVYVNTVHAAIVNTCALRAANITRQTPDPPGGLIERDDTTGEPTGVIREWHALLPIMDFTYEQVRDAVKEGVHDYWVKQGCTTAFSYADARELRVYQDLLNERALPLRIQAPFINIVEQESVIESLVSLGIQPGFGNEWLKVGGVKIFVDGAFMGLSAATFEPYLNLPKKDYYGVLKFDDPRPFNALVLKAHNAGLQLQIHAIGEKAQVWALDAIESALEANPRSHRHRIEHLGNLMTSQERINRAKALGIIPITTVEWLYEEGDFIELYLGPKRRDQSWPLRSMLDAGLKVANCSDTVGATPFSTNPFYSMWCAVTRETFFGNRLIPEEAISVKEALRLYTTHAAYSGFEEDLKGSVEPGKFADLIVLDRDILTIPEDQIREIKVDMSIIDGKIVYQR